VRCRIEKLGVLLLSGEAASIARGLNVLLLLSNPSVCCIQPRHVTKLLPGLCAAVSLPYQPLPLGSAVPVRRPVQVPTPPSTRSQATGDMLKNTVTRGDARTGRGLVQGDQRGQEGRVDERVAEEGMHACAIAAATVICHLSQVWSHRCPNAPVA
jgi:hypothetical protein